LNKPKSWTLDVQEDADGNFYLQLTEEMLEESGMKIGDHLSWVDNGDGSFMLIKEDLTSFIKQGIIKNEQN
jgi:hypothetical protein